MLGPTMVIIAQFTDYTLVSSPIPPRLQLAQAIGASDAHALYLHRFDDRAERITYIYYIQDLSLPALIPPM